MSQVHHHQPADEIRPADAWAGLQQHKKAKHHQRRTQHGPQAVAPEPAARAVHQQAQGGFDGDVDRPADREGGGHDRQRHADAGGEIGWHVHRDRDDQRGDGHAGRREGEHSPERDRRGDGGGGGHGSSWGCWNHFRVPGAVIRYRRVPRPARRAVGGSRQRARRSADSRRNRRPRAP